MSNFITSKQIKDAVANTPQVVFEITDACNLKCNVTNVYIYPD